MESYGMKRITFLTICMIFLLLFSSLGTSVFSQQITEQNHDVFDLTSSSTFDYVIITQKDLYHILSRFSQCKEDHGFQVKIINISWIQTRYSGEDISDKIRSFLQDKYLSWDIDYVLLVGSHDVIPLKKCYPRNYYPGYQPVYTDMYYADLTSDWDSDQDGFHGEIQDSFDGSIEIRLGRIPFDDPYIIQQILNKSMAYESDEGEWKKKALLFGSFLWLNNHKGHPDTETDGAELLERVWSDFLSPQGYQRITLYEKEGLAQSRYSCDYPLNHSNLKGVWSEGFGLVNWVCHGTAQNLKRVVWTKDNGDSIPYTGNDTVESKIFFSNQGNETNNDIIVLNSTHPAIVFSTGCENAKINDLYAESIAESVLKQSAIIFIGPTDDAFGPFNWTTEKDGGVETLDYLFIKYFINDQRSCGEALSLAKTEYYQEYMENGPVWWNLQNIFTVILLGDPSVFHQNTPSKPLINGPSTVNRKQETTYEFQITDPQNDLVFLQIDWGDGNMTNWLGPFSSEETITQSHQWQKKSEIILKARAKDEQGWNTSWNKFPLMVNKKKTGHVFPFFVELLKNKTLFFSWYFKN